jgi:hypothetical protein
MGGAGSGQWYRWNAKRTVEGYRSIDVRDWHRQGLTHPHLRWITIWQNREGQATASLGATMLQGAVELAYAYNDEPLQYRIPLTWTPGPYGGRRVWFRCPPGLGCGRRVAKLYLAGRYFLCRCCYKLTYASQQVARCDRPMHRAHNIQQHLGGQPGFAYPFPPKPKGMHWRTYRRWQFKYQKAKYKALAALAERFDLAC